MKTVSPKKPPIINCHTHIFTGDHVPKWLAKGIIPAPLYFLLNIHFFIRVVRWWQKEIVEKKYKATVKKREQFFYKVKMFLLRNPVLKFGRTLVIAFLTIELFYLILQEIFPRVNLFYLNPIKRLFDWGVNAHIIFPITNTFFKIGLILIILIFIKFARNLLFFVLSKLFSGLGVLPGKQTKELFARYFNIIFYAYHKKQDTILNALSSQYPQETKLVILPMDMEYMEAGKVNEGYLQQMENLAGIYLNKKDTLLPFIFADPRRIKDDPTYFNYDVKNDGSYTIDENCFVKKYLVDKKFKGIKIYPALGYYPFDENLLPLFKYAADHHIPITTHCIRGIIYFRGNKKKEWDKHPIFKESFGKNEAGESNYMPLLLNQSKNADFSTNFTHPLNYLCLLNESLLREIIGNSSDEKLKKLFGYSDANTTLKHNLGNLKICFGHFGGDDEWKNYFEKDKYIYSNQIIQNPAYGINFFENKEGKNKKGKIEQIWKYVDWYSIIVSLIIQYPNVYADISYILHNNSDILPLLRQTLRSENLKVRSRVLYGTDFYVVRNHKSDKNMLSDLQGGLTEVEFDLIARENPRDFLNID